MNSEKAARRKKAEGRNPDDTNKSNATYNGAPPAQPMPSAPQGQGNIMNTPQTAMGMQGSTDNPSSLSGVNLYPYMDGGIPQTMGAIAPPTGLQQGMVVGRGRNQAPYGAQPQPNDEQSRMIQPQYFANSSIATAQKAGASQAMMGNKNAQIPSYQVAAMGPVGAGPDMPPMAGAFPSAMDTRNPMTELPIQGMADAQQAAQMGLVEGNMGMKPGPTSTAMGMNTGRSGGRNRKKTT